MKEDLKFDSVLIHGCDEHDAYGAAVLPIYQTSTFRFKNADHGAACFAGEDPGYIYTRIGNPTINALENTLAKFIRFELIEPIFENHRFYFRGCT